MYQQVDEIANGRKDFLITLEDDDVMHMANLVRDIPSIACTKRPPIDTDLTNKVHVLAQYLVGAYSKGIACVIFVQRRSSAYALREILAHMAILSQYRCFTFVGSSNTAGQNLVDLASLKVQREAFADFRAGKQNVCIATEVLEEGIDVQACNLVINFDPPATAKSYIQRRGRARHVDAAFVLMHAEDYPIAKLQEWHALEERLKKLYAEEDRQIQQLADRELAAQDALNLPPLINEVGARVNVEDARQRLGHFCQTLRRQKGEAVLQPIYRVTQIGPLMYTCKVILPNLLPADVREVVSSEPRRAESAAKKDAAFAAYKLLHSFGLLNEHLLPIHPERERRSGPGRDPIETRAGIVDTRPLIEPFVAIAQESILYAHRLSIEGLPAVVIMLPLQITSPIRFKLHMNVFDQLTAHVSSTEMLECYDRSLLKKTTTFLYLSVLKRRLPELGARSFDLPYFVVPDCPLSGLERWLEGCSVLNPLMLSELAKGQPGEILLYKHGEQTPYIYRGVCCDNDGSESIEAVRIHQAIDFTRSTNVQQAPSNRRLYVQECMVSGLEAGYAKVMAYMPSIMHHVKMTLRAQLAHKGPLQNIGFKSSESIRAALVAPCADENSYQRLEFMGDAVLKFMATINVFCNNPKMPEGTLSELMERIINNARLHRSTLELGLDRYITTEAFSTKSWSLDVIVQERSRRISTKVLADVVEALLGIAYAESGDSMTAVVRALSAFVPELNWRSPEEDVAGVSSTEIPAGLDLTRLKAMEQLINYEFGRPLLLAEAMNHSSSSTAIGSYDRLEFLGDAIIDLIVKSHLFKSEHEFNEDYMTVARHALVNKETLAFLSTRLCTMVELTVPVYDPRTKKTTMTIEKKPKHLHDYLTRLPSLEMAKQRTDLLQRYAEVESRLLYALEHDNSWPWADFLHLSSPKWASDVLESIVGAVFIDSGASLEACTIVLEAVGLMALVRRASRREITDWQQKRAILRLKRPGGRVVFSTGQSYNVEGDGGCHWSCAARIDNKTVAYGKSGSCEAESEERASEVALQMLARQEEQADAAVSFDGARDSKRARLALNNHSAGS